jgi:hypothetical protein
MHTPCPSSVVLLYSVKEVTCRLDTADAEEGRGEVRAAVDEVEWVDSGVADSSAFVIRDTETQEKMSMDLSVTRRWSVIRLSNGRVQGEDELGA